WMESVWMVSTELDDSTELKKPFSRKLLYCNAPDSSIKYIAFRIWCSMNLSSGARVKKSEWNRLICVRYSTGLLTSTSVCRAQMGALLASSMYPVLRALPTCLEEKRIPHYHEQGGGQACSRNDGGKPDLGFDIFYYHENRCLKGSKIW